MGGESAQAGVQYEGLDDHDIQVLRSRAVIREIASERPYRTVTSRDELAALGYGKQQRQVPALLFPRYNPVGTVSGYFIRPHNPRTDKRGKQIKYEAPTGSSIGLDVPPRSRSYLHDPEEELWITEGSIKADAGLSAGLRCIIAIAGVWNWSRGPEVLTDWESIVLNGRRVLLAFDSDTVTNTNVHQALTRFTQFLCQRGAIVHYVLPPTAENGTKQGLDDYLAAGGTLADLQARASQELPAMPVSEERAGPYRQSEHGIVYERTNRDGSTSSVPLTNFPARIVAEVTRDDGVETSLHYAIAATVANRSRHLTVSANQYQNMSWTSELGARALLYPGQGAREHARTAIQQLSMERLAERHVYAHTGWTERDGVHTFLTASGGIDRDGAVPNVSVELDAELRRCDLPAPPEDETLRAAIRASVELLDAAPRRATSVLLGAVWRAPLDGGRPSYLSVHVYGETGAGKTELAALMQQHFGPEMDARHLPGDWQSTDNALERMLHQSKDVVTVVDEYKPPDNARGRALYQQRAERIFRGVGNHSGRRRMRADLSLAPSHPPRGLLLSTGEEQPSGQSLAARRIDVDLRPGDVDMDRLSECQRRARDGVYAQAMAGYVRYRAGQIDDRAPAAADFDALRHEAVEAQAHLRTASNLAELGLGWASFLAFAVEVGAITVERRAELWGDLWRELIRIGAEQGQMQRAADPVARFFDLVRDAVASTRVHLADLKTGDAPADAERYGWRLVPGRDDHEYRALGTRIGWIDDRDLHLMPEATYAAAQRLAQETGEPFSLTQRELWRRLDERGLLASREKNRGRYTQRVIVGGQRRDLLHLHTTTLFEPSQPSQPSHNSPVFLPGRQHMGQSIGTVDERGPLDRPSEPSHDPPKSGVRPASTADVGQLGRLGQLEQPTPSIRACSIPEHTDFWRNDAGEPVCGTCHPRAHRVSA